MTPAAIRLLAEKGLSGHDIAEIAEALVPARSSGAERQARYRQRKSGKRNEGDVTGDVTRPPNESILTPGSPPLANANERPPSVEDRFVEAWNAEAGLRPARKLSGQRQVKFRRRLKEFGEATVFEGVRKLGNSPFHCGKNDREWQADIGWYVRSEDNVTKALELPDPGASPAMSEADRLAAAERTAALFRRMGRDDDAAEAEKRAARLRAGATGPPAAIGAVLKAASGHR